MKALNKVKALLDDLRGSTKLLTLNFLADPTITNDIFFTPASSFINTLANPACFHESNEMMRHVLS